MGQRRLKRNREEVRFKAQRKPKRRAILPWSGRKSGKDE